jgi:hypothetical protein
VGGEYYCIQKHIGTRHATGNKGVFSSSFLSSLFVLIVIASGLSKNALSDMKFFVWGYD